MVVAVLLAACLEGGLPGKETRAAATCWRRAIQW